MKKSKKIISKAIIVLFIVISLFMAWSALAQENSISFYSSSNGKKKLISTFSIELAITPEKRKTGLMFRDSLAINNGMLFIFDEPLIASMWMKNTMIPLDMIFIGEDLLVKCIIKNTTPYSLEARTCKLPAKYALEINGGLSDKLGITINNKVEIIK